MSLSILSMEITGDQLKHACGDLCFFFFFTVLVAEEQAQCFMTANVFERGLDDVSQRPESADLVQLTPVCFICKCGL